jgi:formylglycine-generating enzyme required for sulfatase activity
MGSLLSPQQVVDRFGGIEKYYEDEQPPHDVKIYQSIYLQTTEVTQGQWKEVMGENPSKFKKCGDDCPVEDVSWEETQRFIEKLNHLEKTKAYRLPSEAEWEYACRAGTTTEFSFGDDASRLIEYAWYSTDFSKSTTHRVATKEPNHWGLYDMYGNVWEWVEDDWHDSYEGAPTHGKAWVDNPRGSNRVFRGGAWTSYVPHCRSAGRGFRPYLRDHDVGFRLAMSP